MFEFSRQKSLADMNLYIFAAKNSNEIFLVIFEHSGKCFVYSTSL